MFANDELDASLATNIFGGGPSHTLSMFFLLKVMEI
jgi:hypothetical protein